MTKILAIETSTDACSAALWLDHAILERFLVTPQGHAVVILSMVNELLQASKLELGQLTALAFGHGPGSFTGVRLAASVIQGFASATYLQAVGISTLRALAMEAFSEFHASQILVAQDARMGEVYWGEYQVDDAGIMRPLVPDQLLKPQVAAAIAETRAGFVGVGNGFNIYSDFFLKSCKMQIIDRQYARASHVAELAAGDFTRGEIEPVEVALPVYLREKVAWVS